MVAGLIWCLPGGFLCVFLHEEKKTVDRPYHDDKMHYQQHIAIQLCEQVIMKQKYPTLSVGYLHDQWNAFISWSIWKSAVGVCAICPATIRRYRYHDSYNETLFLLRAGTMCCHSVRGI